METNKILSANILDILFEGKNKDYGAYELRKTDSVRTATALGVTGLAIALCLCSFISKKDEYLKKPPVIITIDPSHKADEPKIIPRQKVVQTASVKTKTIAFPPPQIVIDKLADIPQEENKNFDDARVALKTSTGIVDNGISAPVEILKSNVIEVPRTAAKEEDKPFITVEIEAQFKGDWVSYVKKEIEKHVDELADAGQSGTCMVKFIVAKDGTVSNVEATTMKGTKLAEVAVNAIKKGPKWIPAIQNGEQVNAYRMQPVSFQLQDQ